ncbi:MAG: hypothetical protein ACI8S6_004175 [Myxococcota bacterium]|jgi:uncharacterized protein (TIRG00374 family)
MSTNLVHRFSRWVIVAIAFAALLALAGSIWTGIDDVREAFAGFQWAYLIPIVLLTLANYGLRFLKWHYLLKRLGVDMPIGEDAWNFMAGLAMVISPGKAGELLKPYFVRARTGTPMARTIPALITERLTDAVAIIALASIGAAAFSADQLDTILALSAVVLAGLLVLASPRLSLSIIRLLGRLPLIKQIAGKLEVMYEAMRTCLAPMSLFLTVGLSLLAWSAECFGYQLVFWGLGLDASLVLSTFLYATATLVGGPSPGGLGLAESFLVVGTVNFIPAATEAQAVAAALIIRTATLWLGVLLGAGALLRISALLGGEIDLEPEPS